LPVSSANQALVQRLLQEAFNRGNLAVVEECVTPDVLLHDPGLELRGSSALARGIGGLRTAFPDFQFTVEHQLSDGDTVAIRYRGEGTHRGEFKGIGATGRRIRYGGIIMLRIEKERVAEIWAQPDMLGVLQQLGARLIME
jgi:predicted ester cyclase